MYCFAVPVGPLFQFYPQHRFKFQLFGLVCASVGLIGSAFATAVRRFILARLIPTSDIRCLLLRLQPIHILVCLGLIYPMAV